MRRFERSSHCLAPVPTAHAAEAYFCRLPQNHGKSLEYLSRHDLELDTDQVGFNAEHTGMCATTGGEGSSPISATLFERA